MLYFFRRLIILCLLFILPSCQSGSSQPVWTVLVYMAGDNNLSNAANIDLLEMMTVGSDSNIRVVVQFDSSSNCAAEAVNSSGCVWRLSIEQGRAELIESLGERNMADPQTLTDFLVWAADRYPSHRRALILWSHGNGYQKPKVGAVPARPLPARQAGAGGRESPLRTYSILQDDTDGMPCCLSNAIVRQAIEATGMHFDLLGFDASQMGQIETAYEFRNVADLLVFSQETGQENGWDYAAILNELRQRPGTAAEALAETIVQSYRDFYEQSFYPFNPSFEQYLTISAVRLGEDIEPLTSSVDDLAKSLTAAIQDPSTRDATVAAVGSAAAAAQGMDLLTSPYVYLDLFDLVDKLSEQPGLNRSTHNAIADLKALKDGVVIAEYHGIARPGASGLSIVFFKLPEAVNFNIYDPDYVSGARNLGFLNDTAWNEFLSAYYTAAGLL